MPRPFQPQLMDAAQLANVSDVRTAFERVADEIVVLVPAGRYRSLAMTALEEACMWAVKGISHETRVLPIAEKGRIVKGLRDAGLDLSDETGG